MCRCRERRQAIYAGARALIQGDTETLKKQGSAFGETIIKDLGDAARAARLTTARARLSLGMRR